MALLINNPDYAGMSEDIIDRITKRNAEFNKKTTDEYLLINKQCVLYLTAQGYAVVLMDIVLRERWTSMSSRSLRRIS